MAVAVKDGADPAFTRPASGIVIDPVQLTRMRDLRALSREDLASRAGGLLFDRGRLDRVLASRAPADARLARALWLALECQPGDLIAGLPPGLPRNSVSRWLRQNGGWSLRTEEVIRVLAARRGWTMDDLAAAAARYWFSRDSVNKIERGERRPKARTLRAFCKILGCTPADLMPGGRRLPDGATRARRELLDYNAALRAFAAAEGISYRTPGGRIRYSPELREAYARHLTGQGGELAL